MTPERDFVEYLPPPAPAWHARPTSPGWWVMAYKRNKFARFITDEELATWKDNNSYTGFFGPIPEPPEPTP